MDLTSFVPEPLGENRRQKSGHVRCPCRGARDDELMRTAASSHAQIAESRGKRHVILTQGRAMDARRVSTPAIGDVTRSSRTGKSCKRLSAASGSGGPRREHARAMCTFGSVLAHAFSITSRARRSRNLGFCRTLRPPRTRASQWTMRMSGACALALACGRRWVEPRPPRGSTTSGAPL